MSRKALKFSQESPTTIDDVALSQVLMSNFKGQEGEPDVAIAYLFSIFCFISFLVGHPC